MFSGLLFAKSYKINLELKNSSNSDLSISYQKGFVLDATNGSNIYIGDLKAGETKSFEEKNIKVNKGETIYIIINMNGSNISVNNFRVDKKPPKTLSFDIRPPASKNSNNPITSQSTLETTLRKFGSNEVSEGNLIRAQVNIPLSKGMSTICGGLVVVDMSKLNENKEFEFGDIEYIVPSYVLGTTPVKIDPQGSSIYDEFEYESDVTLSAVSSFPLAGSLNFGFSNANYYKSKIEIKEAGWVPLVNPNVKGHVACFSAISDFETQLNKAIDIKEKLEKCEDCRVYTVEYAFFYESLLLTTSKYDKLGGTSDASVSSVVSINGAYKRKESKDFTNSRGSTIAYISLTNDVTASIIKSVESIIEKAYINKQLGNINYNLEKTVTLTNMELTEFGISIDPNKSLDLENYLSTEKLELIKSFTPEKMNTELKKINEELK